MAKDKLTPEQKADKTMRAKHNLMLAAAQIQIALDKIAAEDVSAAGTAAMHANERADAAFNLLYDVQYN